MPLYPAVLDLSTLDGSDGFEILGAANFSYAGFSLGSTSDINGDGYDDIVIGAPLTQNADGKRVGAAYVLYGHSGASDPLVRLSHLDGDNGYAVLASSQNLDNHSPATGQSVVSLGDINGDGFADFMISAALARHDGVEGSGAAYVVFGGPGGAPSISVDDLNGTNGFTVATDILHDEFGGWMGAGGDINGDGYADILLADPNYNHVAGRIFVIFGHAGGFSAELNPASLDGSNGFTIEGPPQNPPMGGFGETETSVGDLNGDGIGDIVVGEQAGAYFLPGSTSGFEAVETPSSMGGYFVASPDDQIRFAGGDINGDGHQDLIVGDWENEPAGTSLDGKAYIEFGGPAFQMTLTASDLNGANGFSVSGFGSNDRMGASVSSGDINGDGYDDVVIGTTIQKGTSAIGSVYVIFGKADGFSATVDLTTLDGDNGFRIDGPGVYSTGNNLDAAGDINNDGFDDVVIGAYSPSQDAPHVPGSVYVVYGKAPDVAVDRHGTDAGQTLAGSAFDDQLSGRHGDDTLYGNAGNDQLFGGDGDDVLKGGAGIDVLRGNAGSDTAAYDQAVGGVHVDLSITGRQHVGGGQHDDTLISIENLSGSRFGDVLIGSDKANTLIGLNGNDTLTGGLGSDRLDGGHGQNIFAYSGVADSTGRTHDTIVGFDTGRDLIDLAQTVAGVDAAVASGHLDAAHINAGLVTAIGAAQLGAFDAVLFTPDSGSLAGKTFLIVDANGTAGYQADSDYVIQLDGAAQLDALSSANFV